MTPDPIPPFRTRVRTADVIYFNFGSKYKREVKVNV